MTKQKNWYVLINDNNLGLEDKINSLNILFDEYRLLFDTLKIIAPKKLEFIEGCMEYLIDALEASDEVLVYKSSKQLLELFNKSSKWYFLCGKGVIKDYVESYMNRNNFLLVDEEFLPHIKQDIIYIKCDDVEIPDSDNKTILDLYKYVWLVYLMHPQYWISKEKMEKTINEAQTVVTGMSYFRDAIKADEFEHGISNLSNGSQDLYYDLLMLKRAVKNASNLKNVVMGLAPYSLYYDETLSKVQVMQGRPFPYAHDFLDTHNLDRKIASELMHIRMQICETIGINICDALFKNVYHFYAESRGFDENQIFKPLELDEKQNLDEYNKHSYTETKDENIKILKEYISICKYAKLKLFVLIPPFSQWNYNNWKVEYIEELLIVLEELKREYYFEVIDFTKEQWGDYYFRDYSHVNKIGAHRLSIILNRIIENSNESQL